MKTYRELYFKGSEVALRKFLGRVLQIKATDWHIMLNQVSIIHYLEAKYVGCRYPKAIVSICIEDNYIQSGKIKVGNIVPTEKTQLTLDEYNQLLLAFYNDIIKQYREQGSDIEIDGPTDDIFDPLTVISEEALKKLKAFCNLANKSTGSAHPLDEERWMEFICQTVEDGRMFDYDTLAKFLQDKSYWGEKDAGYLGVIGKYAWSEDMAYKLADEYEYGCKILKYYKQMRGL